jgi:PatG C-terminal
METETNELSATQPGVSNGAQTIAPRRATEVRQTSHSHVSPVTCTNCGAVAEANGIEAAAASYVFALGRIEMRFPTLAVEKEFAQATGRSDTKGLTDRKAIHAVLSDRANRYLLRQVCWIFTIEGLETYILVPRDPVDYDQLLEAVRPQPTPLDIDVVVGMRGPIAPPEMCNGLMVPIVAFDQIYSFDRDALLKALPTPKGAKAREYETVAGEVFDRIMLLADNAGATDEHRALNYMAVRYPALYSTVADAFERDSSLTAVDVQSSPLSSTRNIVDVIFSFTNRKTDVVEKFFTRCDVTEEFPFLVTKMSPYFDR